MKKIDIHNPPKRTLSKALEIAAILEGYRSTGKIEMPRQDVCRLARVSWRTLRIACEILRARGIMAFSKGNGYFVALTAEECEGPYQYRKQYAMTILKDLRCIRHARRRMIDRELKQGELFGENYGRGTTLEQRTNT